MEGACGNILRKQERYHRFITLWNDSMQVFLQQLPLRHILSFILDSFSLARLLSRKRLIQYVVIYKWIRSRCRCATAFLGQQATVLDAYVRQRIRRCRLTQRGGSETYRRANMLSVIYTHERRIGAGLPYAERIIREAAMGHLLTDDDYLVVIHERRGKTASAKRQSKASDTAYWARRAIAYERAQECVRRFESK
ncbi:hypothetical protein MM817_02872 [Acidibacillus sp. S0AB]|uniref:Uncharacterized protein n=1 Tax=Sulfoacidibacillus ferrooxidans TaxID=2005001 RepID=A0A9X1VBA0_9BACL|nr:hypothetical protein [Sulfoacidibacillus ferrooxidans]